MSDRGTWQADADRLAEAMSRFAECALDQAGGWLEIMPEMYVKRSDEHKITGAQYWRDGEWHDFDWYAAPRRTRADLHVALLLLIAFMAGWLTRALIWWWLF